MASQERDSIGYFRTNMLGKTVFNKAQRFSFANNVPLEVDSSQRNPKLHSVASRLTRPSNLKPAWEAFDKQTLCFDAVLHETFERVSQFEKYRFRKCKIYYFLEDDTMEIVEPEQKNLSGRLHGALVNRHRFKKPRPDDDEFYTFFDLNVDLCLEIYGRMYKITSCDKFTRQFLTEFGTHVKDPVAQPIDPYTEQRYLELKGQMPKKQEKQKDKLQQFLDYHPEALRFYCIWDDTSVYGDKWKFKLLYHLGDDTIEIIEEREPNSGRTETITFLKRTLLPKKMEQIVIPGEFPPKTLLNVCGTRGKDLSIFSVDTNPVVPGRVIDYYKDKDLDIGIHLNVYGRSFFVYDCNEFTKEFYRTKYGRELVSIELPKDVKIAPIKEIYPHVFGGAEDSLQCCLRLIPKTPKQDASKFYVNDKFGYESNQLAFDAVILTEDRIKKTRRFIITFFLADDTIQIYEPFRQNTGLLLGMHLARTKLVKPDLKFDDAALPAYYSPKDFYVGNIIAVNGEKFLLTKADEYSYNYMEKNASKFVHSNIEPLVLKMKQWLSKKARELKRNFESFDEDYSGCLPFDSFRKVVFDSIPETIPEHEIITLARKYAESDDTDVDFDDVLSRVQTELNKKNFRDFESLATALQEYDVEKTGTFTPEELYLHLRANKLPVSKDLLNVFLLRFPYTECDGNLDYSKVLNKLNYLKNPVDLWTPVLGLRDLNWKKCITRKFLGRIKYSEFIEDFK